MDSLERISTEAILFLVLYGGAIATALIFCLYLLLCKGKAIAPRITPPMRLRRWTAALFGLIALGHIWWILAYIFFSDKQSWNYLPLIILDCVTLTITMAGTLLSMLQDRYRPVWPFVAATFPIVILGGLQFVWPAVNFVPPIIIYTLSLYALFTVYMAKAVMEYKRWLRDNFADLEHKEVWVSHTLLILFLLMVAVYGFSVDGPLLFMLRIADFVLLGLVLWRVETLPSLTNSLTATPSQKEEESECYIDDPGEQDNDSPTPQAEAAGAETVRAEALSRIGPLLTKHCEDTKLYLQHDLSLTQLSAAIGINRYYLGQYFANQGTNYYTYIHDLRIRHFINLCREAVAAQRPFTARQLAGESGFRSYSTFSAAFKQRMGQSVTSWMRETEEQNHGLKDL